MMEVFGTPDDLLNPFGVSALHGVTDTPVSSMALADLPDFTLGGLSVSPARRLVSGSSGAIAVEPRIMQLLVVLAESPGKVISRDQLVQRCWGGVFVAEDSLNRAVSELRRALRDAGLAADAIETIPRTGYRLTLPVAAAAQSVAPPAPGSPAADSGGLRPLASTAPAPHPSLGRRALIAGAAAIGVGAAGALLYRQLAPDPLASRAADLAGEAELALRPNLPADDARAIALLEQATRLQPDDAGLWGRLALARARSDEHANPDDAGALALAVQDAARRARVLDPGNVDAAAAEALAIPYYGDWLAAERRFDAVLGKDPAHLVTLDARGFLLTAVGRVKEASQQRMEFSPRAPFDAGIQRRLIYAHWFLGDIAGADRVAARALEMWPKHLYIWSTRLWMLAGSGRLDRAIAMIEDEAGRPPLPRPFLETLKSGFAAAASGARADTGAAVDRVMQSVSQNPGAVISAMMLLPLMGALDEAFRLADAYFLEQGPLLAAVQWHSRPNAPDQRRRKTNMLFTPVAASMQQDPRFLPLMQQMGLAQYWNMRGIGPDFLQS